MQIFLSRCAPPETKHYSQIITIRLTQMMCAFCQQSTQMWGNHLKLTMEKERQTIYQANERDKLGAFWLLNCRRRDSRWLTQVKLLKRISNLLCAKATVATNRAHGCHFSSQRWNIHYHFTPFTHRPSHPKSDECTFHECLAYQFKCG